MTTFQDTHVCKNCGHEFWYEADLKSGSETPLSMCYCMKRIRHKDHVITNYAQFSAGLQQDVLEVVEILEAFLDGSLSSPEKSLEELARSLRCGMSGWQALDTWLIEPPDEEEEE